MWGNRLAGNHEFISYIDRKNPCRQSWLGHAEPRNDREAVGGDGFALGGVEFDGRALQNLWLRTFRGGAWSSRDLERQILSTFEPCVLRM